MTSSWAHGVHGLFLPGGSEPIGRSLSSSSPLPGLRHQVTCTRFLAESQQAIGAKNVDLGFNPHRLILELRTVCLPFW